MLLTQKYQTRATLHMTRFCSTPNLFPEESYTKGFSEHSYLNITPSNLQKLIKNTSKTHETRSSTFLPIAVVWQRIYRQEHKNR